MLRKRKGTGVVWRTEKYRNGKKKKGAGVVRRTDKYRNGNKEKESKRGGKNGELSEW
jgi:hypothetical protein